MFHGYDRWKIFGTLLPSSIVHVPLLMRGASAAEYCPLRLKKLLLQRKIGKVTEVATHISTFPCPLAASPALQTR